MAIAYKSQGAGAATATNSAALSPACPATVDANDILIAHVCYRDTSTTPSTPSGWTLLAGPQSAGSTATGRHWVFGKLAAGTEDGTTVAFGTTGGTTVRHARIYSFSGYVSGTISTVVVGFGHGSGTSTSVADTGVTTTVAGARAVNLVYICNDDAVAAFTGQSGGTWSEAVAEFTTTLGSDGCMQVQTAAMASAGTINGGAQTIAISDPWGVHGFELRPNPPIVDGTATVAGAGGLAVAPTLTAGGTFTGAGELTATGVDPLAAPAFGSAGTYLTGATSTTMNVAVPSGVAADDIIIVVAYLDGTATVSGLASGFAQATGSPVSPTNQAHRFYVMWKRATGADAGTYNFTLSASTYREAVAVRYTGAVTSGDPWDATDAATANNPNAPLTTPPVSVTTTGADRLLVFAASYWAGQAFTPPAGFTERVDAGSEFTVDDLAQPSAGSSGSVSTTLGSTSFSTAAWLGALKPAAGASTIDGTATLTGAGTVTGNVTQSAGKTLAGAGTATATPTVSVKATLTGAGSATKNATQATTRTLTGAGVLAVLATQTATQTLTGAGTVSASGSEVAANVTDGTATLTGAGSVAAKNTLAAVATIAGAGAFAGSGSEAVGDTIDGTAVLVGAGSVAGKATISVTAHPAGVGVVDAALVRSQGPGPRSISSTRVGRVVQTNTGRHTTSSIGRRS